MARVKIAAYSDRMDSANLSLPKPELYVLASDFISCAGIFFWMGCTTYSENYQFHQSTLIPTNKLIKDWGNPISYGYRLYGGHHFHHCPQLTLPALLMQDRGVFRAETVGVNPTRSPSLRTASKPTIWPLINYPAASGRGIVSQNSLSCL